MSDTDDDEPVSATGDLEPVSSSVGASVTPRPNDAGQNYDAQNKKWIRRPSALSSDDKLCEQCVLSWTPGILPLPNFQLRTILSHSRIVQN